MAKLEVSAGETGKIGDMESEDMSDLGDEASEPRIDQLSAGEEAGEASSDGGIVNGDSRRDVGEKEGAEK